MAGHRPFSQLRADIEADPARAARLAAAEQQLADEQAEYDQTLAEVRRARAMTREQLGRALGVSQARISLIEHQADLYLSTLRSYLAAMGGRLEMIAQVGTTPFPFTLADLFPPDDLTEDERTRESA